MRQLTKDEVIEMDWYQALIAEIQHEFKMISERQSDLEPAFEREKENLQREVAGWSLTLAKPELDPLLRGDVESKYLSALQRIQELDAKLVSRTHEASSVVQAIDAQKVAACLSRLADTLASNNPALGNIELAAHIDAIRCFSDGRVVIRCSRLGALADAVDLLSEYELSATEEPIMAKERKGPQVKPRRLTQRRVVSENPLSDDVKARALWATDPNRFAGLDDRWFEEITLQVPRRISWAEAHAPCVATCRKLGLTEERIAAHFKTTVPTIRNALRIAAETDKSLRNLPRRMPRRRWHEDHAEEVDRLRETGMGTYALARHFKKSDVTIRKALEYARTSGNQLIAKGESTFEP